MIDWIVFDVEIQKTVEQAGGWGNTHFMGVAVAAVWEFAGRRLRLYGPDDLQALRDRLLRADRVSGFNCRSFDLPVVFGVSRREAPGNPFLQQIAPRVDDLLERIWQALGHREKGWTANAIAKATLGIEKIGNGEDAPGWFQTGQLVRLMDYCAFDVQLERDLVEVAEGGGYLRNGQRQLKLPPWQAGPAASPAIVVAPDASACL